MQRAHTRVLFRAVEFVDSVKVLLASGAGGDGVSVMAHEHGNEFAGPGGGNGGNGGNVVARCSTKVQDLRHIKEMMGGGHQLCAESGRSGFSRQAHGKRGKDLWLTLPVGCQISDVDTYETLFDLDDPGMEVVLLEGGQGGKGNAAFANKWRHSPLESTRGLPGNTLLAQLELKLIADCGLIGYPNAGKSSLLSALTTSKPQVASYPFTTLRPYVGVLYNVYGHTCRLADLPGLLEGAYENRGLGHQFLRHVERSKTLAYVVDMTGTADSSLDASVPLQPWEALQRLTCELEYFSPGLSERGVMVFANKMDLRVDADGVPLTKKLTELRRRVPELPVFPISAALGMKLGHSHPETGLEGALAFLTNKIFSLQEAEARMRKRESREKMLELEALFEMQNNGIFRQAEGAERASMTSFHEESSASFPTPHLESSEGGTSLVDQQLSVFGNTGFDVGEDDGYDYSLGHRRLHEYRDWSMRGKPWRQAGAKHP